MADWRRLVRGQCPLRQVRSELVQYVQFREATFLDSGSIGGQASMVRRLLQLVLALGAMIGVFGQGMAFAYAPQRAHLAGKMVMADDCMPGAEAGQPAKQSKPCKGLTLACIAAMGCTLPLAVPDDHALVAPAGRLAPIHDDVPARQLAGRDLAPEPDPPSLS